MKHHRRRLSGSYSENRRPFVERSIVDPQILLELPNNLLKWELLPGR